MHPSMRGHIRVLCCRGPGVIQANKTGIEKALILAAEEDNMHILQMCLDQGTDPNITADDGYNALMVAVCAFKKRICDI